MCTPLGCAHRPFRPSPRVRGVLWVALVVNALMFAVQTGGAWYAQSVALLADAADFLGDALNFGITLCVLGMATQHRARAALLKGACMGLYGLMVLWHAAAGWSAGTVPFPTAMGAAALLAVAANVGVAMLLWSWRASDANLRSAWLCSRNDAVGNFAVLAAAGGVAGTGSAWPDLAVAVLMATLSLTAAHGIVRQASGELRRAQARLA